MDLLHVVPGRAPDGESYGSFATFSDPDGNEFLLQEVTTRLPGRVEEPDVAELAGLLLETGLAHGRFEAVAPEHNWWDWYAPYLSARQEGRRAEQATEAATVRSWPASCHDRSRCGGVLFLDAHGDLRWVWLSPTRSRVPLPVAPVEVPGPRPCYTGVEKAPIRR